MYFASLIIHEITHIGIEQSIINTYNVSQALKERIVDTFVSLNFGELLPDYQIQNRRESRIGKYLKIKADLKDLHKTVTTILNENK
jgi:hypothetical protein